MTFRRENKGGGNKNKKYARKGPGERSFGGSDSARPTMHTTICSACQKECEVPFRPSGQKPVYCRDCFKKDGDVNPREAGGKYFGERSFEEKNSRPSMYKAPYNKSEKSDNNNSMSNEQFKILNAKLDKILEALE